MRQTYKNLQPKKRAFLLAYIDTGGRITESSKRVKITRQMHYDWLEDDIEYAKAFEQAKDEAAATLEDEAVRRAVDGTTKPIFYQGEKCGEVQEYSDSLMMFLLKGLRPDKYRERSAIEHTGPGGGPVTVREVIVNLPLTDAEEADKEVNGG